MFGVKRWLVCGLIAVAVMAEGQTGDAVIAKMYHPAGPLPVYEVATIKKPDPSANNGGMIFIGGARGPQTVKNYILNAYGVSTLSQAQVVGGPAWVGTEQFVIEGKASEELRAAMQKMTNQERTDQTWMMEQSLLADRFKLKAHFEVREMAVYELEPAKGGLKLKEVAAPPPFAPGSAPPPPAPGSPMVMKPGMIMMRSSGPSGGGITGMSGMALTMSTLINLLRGTPDVSGRPIVDKTGFKGNFDLTDLKWAGLGSTSDVDAPSLFTALEEQLGLKLKATKGMVEVLVIDAIERPSEN